ncbi:hypothetical protein [Streptomyces sp. NPDC007355]|uniref:hypothetical protein n=1 Tax=Streptomyces sp. NPDC007355 TaxID=3364778 RepID=UPI00369BB044
MASPSDTSADEAAVILAGPSSLRTGSPLAKAAIVTADALHLTLNLSTLHHCLQEFRTRLLASFARGTGGENAAVSRGRMGDEAFEAIASVLVRAAAEDESNAPDKRLTVRFT